MSTPTIKRRGGSGPLYTTAQVAAMLSLSPVYLRQVARALGVGVKFGRDWCLTADDVEAIRQRKARP